MNQLERARHLVAMADAQDAGEKIQARYDDPDSVWVSGVWEFTSLSATYRIKPKPPIKKWLNFYDCNGVADVIGTAEYIVHNSEESAREARTNSEDGENGQGYLGTIVYEVS